MRSVVILTLSEVRFMEGKSEFQKIWDELSEEYDLDRLDSPNDKINLEVYIKGIIAIRMMHASMHQLLADLPSSSDDVVKMSRTITQLQDANLRVERQLGIDRKTRTKDNTASVADYIQTLKDSAVDFINKRLVKVYCPKCKVMIGRVSAVQDHTEYKATFKCGQCGKRTTIGRKEKDIFYDLEKDDRDWRKKFPVEIRNPESDEDKGEVIDLVLGGDQDGD